jgi:rhodanese-related sulfurtransferase
MNMTLSQTKHSISPHGLHTLLRAGGPVEMLDVRSPAEYAAEHVPGARLVPLNELDAGAFLKQRRTAEGHLYVLCQSGGRARRAIEKFQQTGFGDCVLVEGGTQAWIEAGLPVNRRETKVLPLMRQVQITVGAISALGAGLALTVHHGFAAIPLILGSGLVFAGVTGFCGLALLLAKMPWNKKVACGTGSGNTNNCSANLILA